MLNSNYVFVSCPHGSLACGNRYIVCKQCKQDTPEPTKSDKPSKLDNIVQKSINRNIDMKTPSKTKKAIKAPSTADTKVLDSYIPRIREMEDNLITGMRQNLTVAINMGKAMLEAQKECKKALGHGHWEKWADKNLHFAKAQRNRYMKIAKPENMRMLPKKNSKKDKELTISEAVAHINEKIALAKAKATEAPKGVDAVEAKKSGKAPAQVQDKRKDRGKLTVDARIKKAVLALQAELESETLDPLSINKETMDMLRGITGMVTALEVRRHNAVVEKAA